MKKIALIHYQPLEYYPPVTNFLDYLEKNLNHNIELKVFSSKNQHQRATHVSEKIVIKRSPFPKKNESSVVSFLKQIYFNIYTLLQLLNYKPDTILYYETYSALPAFFYLRFINKKAKLLIHFHEYFSKDWYEGGMKLVKLYHRIEVNFLFKRAYSISHTNEYRMKFFLADYPFLNKDMLWVLPNYPPLVWSDQLKNKVLKFPGDEKELKLVYVGSLSLKATYIKEFCTWLASCKYKFTFDIYCFNLDPETSDYLNTLDMPQFNFYSSGIEYSGLPSVLQNYDIGVILYKGLSNNSKYCASNKLFEYLACGLDVWFSDKMLGTYPYITKKSYPKVIEVDFENLASFDVYEAFNRDGLNMKDSIFFAENVYTKFLEELV
ncbi:glycosyltransferase family 4 protein [Pontibacter qinzhouensis]|uniref:Glycosyltransferase family 4 protein n=1 Tax=Pontibacter qinzhouensis TaxID=2603253 RepID=A0A5C8K698_9BACT|nr:glycosyltransferase family 4 protein [Pontibacter qinzhouensis]TXK46973.1 glycosyltransferase family 4 protein [Pontibacter qinzhouensis]